MKHIDDAKFDKIMDELFAHCKDAAGEAVAQFTVVFVEKNEENSTWLLIGTSAGQEGCTEILKMAIYSELRAKIRDDIVNMAMEGVEPPAVVKAAPEPPPRTDYNLTCHNCQKQFPPGWRKDCDVCGAPHEQIYL